MIDEVLSRMVGKRVLVIGDSMLDKSIHYRVVRESGEFNGRILAEEDRTFYPGGAANVAMNCWSLGARTTLLTAFGTDLQGRHLAGALSSAGVALPTLTWESRRDWGTTTKTRMYITGFPHYRIDADCHHSLDLGSVLAVIRNAEFDLLLLSDYQKGIFQDASFIQTVVRSFRAANPLALVCANPKPPLVTHLPLMDLISVNELEYKACAEKLDAEKATWVMQTRGRRGVVLHRWISDVDTSVSNCPGIEVDNPDVVGCGDATFAATSLALSVYPDIHLLGKIAVAAGTAKARKLGTCPVAASETLDVYRTMS